MIWPLCLLPSISWSLFSQVEYLYYSTTDDPRHDIFEAEDNPIGNISHFLKIEESAMCKMSAKSVTSSMVVMTGVTTGFLYILPIVILPFIYLRISKALKQSENFTRPFAQSGDVTINRKSIIRMQMAVIVCFLICWTPYHVQRIMFVVVTKKDLWNKRILDIQDTLHMIAACCYFLSPVLNPFLYCLLSKRFRRSFHDLKQKMHDWWEANIWSSQNSSSQESSYRANFVARPFMSLPNQPDPSYYQMREDKKSVLICKTDVPIATNIETPQVAVEMLSTANNVREENDIEMTSSNDVIEPNLCTSNDGDKNQSGNDETVN